jgi:hypothetical protein
LVHNQNFEKQKKWNSKIPEPHPLLLESMKYVKKSGHGEEWVNKLTLMPGTVTGPRLDIENLDDYFMQSDLELGYIS